MDRHYYLQLAATGLRMPIGADMVLHEYPDADAIILDGYRLGRVMAEAAERYRTPLAFPLMDLRLEKADLLRRIGISEADIDRFHFSKIPDDEILRCVDESRKEPFHRRNQAHIDSVRYIAEKTGLLPLGMAIGPFSLMTKLLPDPITAVAMAGLGLTGEEDPDVLLAERCLEMAEKAVIRSVIAQAEAGAKAIVICEPAANVVYLSPRQIEAGSGIFERFVMRPNLRLKRQLDALNVDLIFHDCGEMTRDMVRQIAEQLRPVILSLGSSRKLWEDAEAVPRDVVLFGNLPTKNFYSDAVMPVEKVVELTRELHQKMQETCHPYILGSECDVLYVPGAAETIAHKVCSMLACSRDESLDAVTPLS